MVKIYNFFIWSRLFYFLSSFIDVNLTSFEIVLIPILVLNHYMLAVCLKKTKTIMLFDSQKFDLKDLPEELNEYYTAERREIHLTLGVRLKEILLAKDCGEFAFIVAEVVLRNKINNIKIHDHYLFVYFPKQTNDFDCALHVIAACRGIISEKFAKMEAGDQTQKARKLYQPEMIERSMRKEFAEEIKSHATPEVKKLWL